MKEILNENWNILATEDTTRQRLVTKQIRISYKHSHNLSQKLVRAKTTGKTNRHSYSPTTRNQLSTPSHHATNLKVTIIAFKPNVVIQLLIFFL